MARLSVAILFCAAISGDIGLRCYRGQFVGDTDNSGVPVECMTRDGALTDESVDGVLPNEQVHARKTVDTTRHCCCYGDGCNGAFIGTKATSLTRKLPQIPKVRMT